MKPFSDYIFYASFIVFHIETITLCSVNCITLLACLHLCVYGTPGFVRFHRYSWQCVKFWFSWSVTSSSLWPWYSLRQGIIDIQKWKLLQRNHNEQTLCGCQLTALVSGDKIVAGFSRTLSMLNFCVLGALLRENLLMGAFRSSCRNIYNKLVNVCIVSTYDPAVMFLFDFGIRVTFFGFLRILSSYLFVCVPT